MPTMSQQHGGDNNDQREQATGDEQPRVVQSSAGSIWKVPGFSSTMVAIGAAFGAFSLLLPVLPLAVLDSGGSATLAVPDSVP